MGRKKEKLSLLMMANCCVILHKPVCFYGIAKELRKRYPEQYTKLLEFLQERREFIKLYLMEGCYP